MGVTVIIVCLILSAFFSGMEIAYMSSNKVYLGVEKKQKTFFSEILTKLTEKPTQFITAMLIGNNAVLVVYGFFMGDILLQWLYKIEPDLLLIPAVLFQIIISTVVVLLTAEFFPKFFFQIYANTLIKVFAIPAYFFYSLLYWVAKFIITLSNFILVKILRTKQDKEQLYFSRGELEVYISEQMNGVQEQKEVDTEIQIFQNALDFSDVKARDIMTPRTEIVGIDVTDEVNKMKALFVETGYSKLVVYQGTMDNILGYTNSIELFKKPKSIKEVMVSIEYVPETIYIKDLLNIFTKKRKSMAVILDEYGGTSGIITVEDIIEELFGEIEDEHDKEEELIEKELEDNLYLFSARLDVEYINEKYNIGIPEDDSYATLGGFIVNYTKDIPNRGEKISFEGFEIVIELASNKKIELVRVLLYKQQ